MPHVCGVVETKSVAASDGSPELWGATREP